MPDQPATDQLLDLLLTALAERQAQRDEAALHSRPAALPHPGPLPLGEGAEALRNKQILNETDLLPLPPAGEGGRGDEGEPPLPPVSKPEEVIPPPSPPLQLGRSLGRLCLLLAALVLFINLPLNGRGLNLAHLVPSSAALIIRDGLVLKGPGPEIYVLQDNRLRWISSLAAFDYFGYQWDQVHTVDAAYLAQFAPGAPLSLLLKCETSPHIYALENDHKRWIKDIPTFSAQGFVWTDVKIVDCAYLRALPDGPPIPPDAGPPPQP